MAQTKPAPQPQKGDILRANRRVKCSSITTAINAGTTVILNQNPWYPNKKAKDYILIIMQSFKFSIINQIIS